MANLLDSGARRNFDSGAVRDIVDGKGRCDLLPLDAVALVIHTSMYKRILDAINSYVRRGNIQYLVSAISMFCETAYDSLETGILEVAKQYEDGCKKYGERNWEKGIPLHAYIDSGVRHLLKWIRGDDDEPHDRAFVWNILGALWTHMNCTDADLMDLPFSSSSTMTSDAERSN